MFLDLKCVRRGLVGLALGATLMLVAGCDEDPSQPMALMHAAAASEADASHAQAAFTGDSLREQLETYFGERFAEQPAAGLAPGASQMTAGRTAIAD